MLRQPHPGGRRTSFRPMRHRSRLLIALLLALAGTGWSGALRADEAAASPGPAPPDVPIPSVLALDDALRLLRERGLPISSSPKPP